MSTTNSGLRAEQVAATYLTTIGYTVIDRNWKLHKDCEIDIVAQKGKIMHFVEVKYRASDTAGGGLTYITPTKLKHMSYAANRWVGLHNWKGEYVLSAVEVGGIHFAITSFIAEIA